MIAALVVLFGLHCTVLVQGFTPSLKQEVTSLPSYQGKAFQSRHFTGHISVHHNQHLLFYYLVESEDRPEDDPVVLWLTGGPGCSSMDAFIYEHGPFTFNFTAETDAKDGRQSCNRNITIQNNPYSWSKAATVIYVDSPVGVGLSYALDAVEIDTDDEETTNDLREFIVKLLTEVYPELQARELYIAGESYAGVFVPTLATKLLKYNRHAPEEHVLNLKGYAVGNGVTDDFYDGNGQPEFAYNLGLIDPATYGDLLDVCHGHTGFWNATPGGTCDHAVRSAYERFYWLNPYDVLLDCYSPRDDPCITHTLQDLQTNTTAPEAKGRGQGSARRNLQAATGQQSKLQGSSSGHAVHAPQQAHRSGQRQQGSRPNTPATESSPISAALRASAMAQSPTLQWPLSGVRGGWQHAVSWGSMLKYAVPCADRRLALEWLNRQEVRDALHAPPVKELDWQPCSEHIHYLFVPISMIPLHRQALKQGLRVLVYSGDHDFVVPFTGTRAWVYSMGLRIRDEYAPWMMNGQVTGFSVNFKEGLTFATVKGAGHMVPQTSPDRALHLLRLFLRNEL